MSERTSKTRRGLVAAVIVAGGSGERFGAPGGKQLALVLGVPVLGWSVRLFDSIESVDTIVVVCHPDRVAEYSAVVDGLGLQTAYVVVAGGDTRQASVASGLPVVPLGAEVIVVHDGARPLATMELVERVLTRLDASPSAAGVVPGHLSVDTLKEVSGDRVLSTPDRVRFWAIQTPQAFRASALREAYTKAAADGFCGTDDASLVERAGGSVIVVEGPRDNIKLTLPEDLTLVEAVLRQRQSRRRT